MKSLMTLIFLHCICVSYTEIGNTIPATHWDFGIVFDALPFVLLRLLQGSGRFDMHPQLKGNVINSVCFTGVKSTNKFLRRLCQESTTYPAKQFCNSRIQNIKWKSVWNINKKYCVTNKTRKALFKIVNLISRAWFCGKVCFAVMRLKHCHLF